MNPENPSRDEIEAKITALRLGQWAEDEARLLRWSISQDPELAKLHDQLKQVIGLVREVSAKPAESAPLKLAEEKRKKLLAHFKTPRTQETFLVKRMILSRAIGVLVVVAIITLLAAMLLPALSKAKMKARHISQVAALRQRALEQQMEADGRRKEPDKKAEQPTHVIVPQASTIAPPPAATPPPASVPVSSPGFTAIYLPSTREVSQANGSVAMDPGWTSNLNVVGQGGSVDSGAGIPMSLAGEGANPSTSN